MEAATFAANAPLRLRYVPPRELERLRSDVAKFADACRINALSSIMEAGSGHIGTSFSVMDILALLHVEVLEGDDVAFSSKGHDAPAVYAVLAGARQPPLHRPPPPPRPGGPPPDPGNAPGPPRHTHHR